MQLLCSFWWTLNMGLQHVFLDCTRLPEVPRDGYQFSTSHMWVLHCCFQIFSVVSLLVGWGYPRRAGWGKGALLSLALSWLREGRGQWIGMDSLMPGRAWSSHVISLAPAHLSTLPLSGASPPLKLVFLRACLIRQDPMEFWVLSLVYHQRPEPVVFSELLTSRGMDGISQIAELWLRAACSFSQPQLPPHFACLIKAPGCCTQQKSRCIAHWRAEDRVLAFIQTENGSKAV